MRTTTRFTPATGAQRQRDREPLVLARHRLRPRSRRTTETLAEAPR
ncbi:hypothetical protein ACFUJ0_32390 [Streptomyces sp. NPDC057242]